MQFELACIEPLETRTLLSAIVWSPAPDLPVPSGDASATNLYNGILLVGGRNAAGALGAAYQFDPDANTWSTAPSFEPARSAAGIGRTLTVSSAKYNSNLFLFGGLVQNQPSATALNYDPRPDGDPANAPAMLTARSSFAYAADPQSGNLYAIGGLGKTNTFLAAAERYNPAADAWSPIAPLPRSLYGLSAAADGFGHIFVIGGASSLNGSPLASVYRYTIATDTWTSVAPLPTAERNGAAIAAPDGNIYFIGGLSSAGATASVQSYNPALNTWSIESPLPAPVSGAAVAIDAANNLYVVGGFNKAGAPVKSVSVTPITPGVLVPYTPTLTVEDNYFTYDATPHFVTATAVGADGVTPVNGSISFTYNGSSALPTQAGDYKVIATFISADPDYLDTVATGNLLIVPATPTLTLTGGGTIKYDGQPHAATATVASIDGVSPVTGTLQITYNGSASAPVTQGVYNVLATFISADPNYAGATAATTLTIPDPTIPTGLTAVGASTTSIRITWDAVPTPVSGFNVYERHVLHDPKGSGSTITYPLVASNVQGTSATLTVASASAASAGHTYYVSSISPTGVVSARSTAASAKALYAPSLYGALLGGAVVSSADVRAGQSVQITLLAYGNLYPTFSLVSGPGTLAVDPVTGVVTYAPALAESGDVTATFKATNSVGSANETFLFHVLLAPAVSGITANLAPTLTVPLSTAADGLRLLPAGRTTDLPWNGINSLSLTLTAPLLLTAANITLIGSSGTDYGSVTLTGSGATYTITLARPLNTSDRVTLRIDNPAMTPFVRRLDVLPGDISDDGQVDFIDLAILAQNYQRPGTLAQGDLTSDGLIDFADLAVLAQSYATTLPPLPPASLAVTASSTAMPARSASATFSTTRLKPTPPPIKQHRLTKRHPLF